MKKEYSVQRANRIRAGIVSLLFICGVGACASMNGSRSVPSLSSESSDPNAEKAFRAAEQQWRAKDFSTATRSFEDFIRRYPEDRLRPSAQLYLGRIALSRGDPEGAQKILTPLVEGVASATRDYASLYMGRALYETGRFTEALALLSPYAGRFPEQADHLLLLDTLWRSAAGNGDQRVQIIWTEQYLLSRPEKVPADEARAAFNALLQDLVDVREIEAALSEIQEKEWVWAMLMVRLALRSAEIGRSDDMTEIAAILRDQLLGGAGEDDVLWQPVRDLIVMVEQRTRVDMRTVGLILPLSGRMRLVGDAALKGAMLASKQFVRGSGRMPLTVVIKDSGGDPEKAAGAVVELVEQDRVAAIIGPMDGDESVAAALRAESLGVPLISLSGKEGLRPGSGSCVFRRSASNPLEVTALLDAVPLSPGMNVAVLYPENGYGKLMARLMESAVLSRGGKVAVSRPFVPEQTDFSAVVAELASASFEVLMLPMTAAQLALAAPALSAAGIWSDPGSVQVPGRRRVTWLVPSVGYSEQLVQRAGRYLQNVCFVSLYNPGGSPAARDMRQRFADLYRSEPNLWSAYAYDAVMLVGQAIDDGAIDRRTLRDRLASSGQNPLMAERLVIPFSGFDDRGESLGLPRVFCLKGDRVEYLP